MKTDPSRPTYEPRHVVVRRELFRFADKHRLFVSGAHHPSNPHPVHHGMESPDSHWIWFLRSRWSEDVHFQIPVTELLSLLHELYPQRPVHLHVPDGEVGTDALYILVPSIVQRYEGR